MANIEEEKLAPKITRLPLPNSDSPLVIDLPDGQKIVVGKMTAGSVIEVATWRGVGRPDSRTSRLMLGMGNGDVNAEDEAEDGDNSGEKRKRVQRKPEGFAGVIFTVKMFFDNIKHIDWSATVKSIVNLASKKRIKKDKSALTTSAPSEVVAVPVATSPSPTEDADIEAWLDKISEKAARSTSKRSKVPAAKASTTKKAATTKKAVVTKKATPKSAKKR